MPTGFVQVPEGTKIRKPDTNTDLNCTRWLRRAAGKWGDHTASPQKRSFHTCSYWVGICCKSTQRFCTSKFCVWILVGVHNKSYIHNSFGTKVFAQFKLRFKDNFSILSYWKSVFESQFKRSNDCCSCEHPRRERWLQMADRSLSFSLSADVKLN